MASVTIHNMDRDLARAVAAKAKTDGRSLNQTVKVLLRSVLGLDRPAARDNSAEFREFLGATPASEVKRIEQRVSELRAVDPAEWA